MIAKILITVSVLMFTVLPPFADFNKTHVLHPAWLVLENSLIGLFALALIWHQSTNTKLLIAGGLSALILGGFMLATLFMPLYSGTLSDPDGTPSGPRGIDLNLVAFGVGFLLSLSGLILAYFGI